QIANVPVQDADSFAIQDKLASEARFLTELVLGIIRYEARDYGHAIRTLSSLLQEPIPHGDMIDPAVIRFYLALGYQGQVDATDCLKDDQPGQHCDVSAAIG